MTITNETCYAVLTTALEARPSWWNVVTHTRDNNLSIVNALVRCDDHSVKDVDGFEQDTWLVEAQQIRQGIARYKAWVNADLSRLKSGLGSEYLTACDEGWEFVDATGADAVLQFATFGEIVFG